MVFFLGVFMAIGGLGLLIPKELWLGRRPLRKAWARGLGVVLIAFFPVALLVSFLLKRYDPEESVDVMIVHGSLAGLWALVCLVMLYKATRPSARLRPAADLAPG